MARPCLCVRVCVRAWRVAFLCVRACMSAAERTGKQGLGVRRGAGLYSRHHALESAEVDVASPVCVCLRACACACACAQCLSRARAPGAPSACARVASRVDGPDRRKPPEGGAQRSRLPPPRSESLMRERAGRSLVPGRAGAAIGGASGPASGTSRSTEMRPGRAVGGSGRARGWGAHLSSRPNTSSAYSSILSCARSRRGARTFESQRLGNQVGVGG